ncbi:hypothetical protein GGX14DRAFT_578552 [Mycena pura]|uniref:Uncharacterized protein n=1 Tax=Mycena pura TaxID=153505 RepID=A0AAD6UPV4_9AGAR|nr:hypothetical protein GGX14DRAFT_578552 [Mycena pura]
MAAAHALAEFQLLSLRLIDNIQIGFFVLAGEVFFYGGYAVMFGYYLHVLHARGISKNRFLTVATISLFVLCSALLALLAAESAVYTQISKNLIGVSSVASLDRAENSLPLYATLDRAANAIYITTNVIADSIFVSSFRESVFLASFTILQIFRCYAIWNFQLKVVIIPILLTISGAGFGYTNLFVSVKNHVSQENGSEGSSTEAHLFMVSMGVSVLTTVVLMGLSAGRIWWFARTARKMGVRRLTSRYYTVSAMILESGALYCVGTIVFIILAFQVPRGGTYITSGAVLGQLVGIAPTLIAVRVGLGKSVDSVDSFIEAQPRRARVPFEVKRIPSMEEGIVYLGPDSEYGKAEIIYQ